MLETLIGIVSGMVAALGMGGGTILILLLGIFTNLEQHIIQATNLVFFIPTSIVAIIMNIKNKKINYKNAVTIIISGIIGAVIGSKISFKFENSKLRKLFGIFLMVIAILKYMKFIHRIEKIEKQILKINKKN